jgi:hypothetical protein
MSPEQQRRLIGNDIGMIFFQGKDDGFRCAMRGNVNSVAAVLSPSDVPGKYKIGVFRRGNIKGFNPPIPENGLISKAKMRDVLLSKMVNGELSSHRSPPLSNLHARVFKNSLEILAKDLTFTSDKSNKTLGLF